MSKPLYTSRSVISDIGFSSIMGTITRLVILATVLSLSYSQSLPRRLQIPGAVPIGGPIPEARPIQYRRPVGGLGVQALGPAPRVRRPIPPPQQIRPVVEDSNEDDGPLSRDEVARLQNIPIINSQPAPQPVRSTPQPQRIEDEEEENVPIRQYAPQSQPQPIQFRPAPVVRLPPQQSQQPIRQQVRAQAPARPRQPQAIRDDDDNDRRQYRTRKPPVKILRKYREDNPDGSITWGYENDDGTFKEETIGIDCVTRGKYGYIDPDGNRREYSYETGLRCDIPQEDEELEEELVQQRPGKQPLPKRPVQLAPVRLQ